MYFTVQVNWLAGRTVSDKSFAEPANATMSPGRYVAPCGGCEIAICGATISDGESGQEKSRTELNWPLKYGYAPNWLRPNQQLVGFRFAGTRLAKALVATGTPFV